MNTSHFFLLGAMCIALVVTVSAEPAGGSAGAGGASTSASATSDASLPSPMGSDTDEDGISDWDEVYLRGSDPKNPDTDGDGVGDAQDGWPRVKWLTIPPLPEVRYAVIPLRATGWPIDANAQEIDDKGDVLGSQNSAYIFLQAGMQQPVTVPIGPSWVWMGWGDLLGALSPDGYVVGSVTTVSNGNVTVDGYEDSESNAAIWSPSEGITQFPHMDDGYSFSGPPDVFGRYGEGRAINRSGVVVGMQSASMNIAYQREDDPGLYYLGPVGGSVGGILYSTPSAGGAWVGPPNQKNLYWEYFGDEVWYEPPLLGYWPIAINDQGLIGASIMEQYANTVEPSGENNNGDSHLGSVVIENGSVYRLDPSPALPVRIRQITSGTPIVIFGDEGNNPNRHPWWAHRENSSWSGEPLKPFDPLVSDDAPSALIYYMNGNINDRLEIIFNKQVVANQTLVTTHHIVRNGVIHSLDSMISSNWNVTNARDINNHGVILAEATRTLDDQGLPITDPQPEPVLLVPMAITFEALGDAVPPTDNKNPSTGIWMPGKGLRIFPDAKTPTETTPRNWVQLKVTTGLPSQDVFLKILDVDDPSSDLIIDPNDATVPGRGDDNLTPATVSGGVTVAPAPPYFYINSTRSFTCRTDSQGVARLENGSLPVIVVGMQPGDNLRVAASLKSAADLNALQVTDQTDSTYVSPDDQQPTGITGAVSPMLTIWRKLNVEVDSMGAIPEEETSENKNYEISIVANGNYSPPSSLIEINLISSIEDHLRFNESYCKVQIENIGTFDIFSFDSPNKIKIINLGGIDISAAAGKKIKVYDDDYIITENPLGNHTQEIIRRLIKHYSPCYIEPIESENTRLIMPFQLNKESYSSDWSANMDGVEKPTFWHHLLILGYQDIATQDMDGDLTQALGGTPESGILTGVYSTIYSETIRDSEKMDNPRNQTETTKSTFLDWIALISAHEIGHVVGGYGESTDHSEDGIMTEGGPDTLNTAFTSKSIRRFRTAAHW